MQQVVKLFLCPSDRMHPVSVAYGEPVIGPTNYAVCVGTGTTNGGPPFGSPWGEEFHRWLRTKYAQHGKTNVYFR